ncbi:hypothetical protein BH23BAC1_BH23BAC1_25410 [soil metagenome]
MFKNLIYILFIFALFLGYSASSQELDSLVEEEITINTKKTLEDYRMLLEIISLEVTDSMVRKFVIFSSTDPSGNNQIFLDKEVIIEDNIDPASYDYNNTSGLTVDDFLNKFHNSYLKSDTFSIQFSNVISGHMREQDDHFTTRVYFESLFRNQHREIDLPYRKTQRVATLRALNNDGAWNTYITNISFFHPSDSAEFFPELLAKNQIPPSDPKEEITSITNQEEQQPAKQEEILGKDTEIAGKNEESSPEKVTVEGKLPDIVIDNDTSEELANNPPIQEKNNLRFTEGRKAYKRGKNYNISWEGGNPQDQVKLDLYKGNRFLKELHSGQNDGIQEHSFTQVKPGSGYSLRINNEGPGSNTSASSSDFRIKRKIPWAVKALTVPAAAVILYYIFRPKPEEWLPDPPKWPGL